MSIRQIKKKIDTVLETADPKKQRQTIKKRRHSLYLNVGLTGPLIIVKMPNEFIRWTEVRQHIYEFLKQDFGVKIKDVYYMEGIAGYPDGVENPEDLEFLSKCDKAFEGSSEYLKAFTLYAWDEATRTFKLARPPVKED